jgi:ankyrin repeat protein
VELLLDNNVKIDAKDKYGLIALQWAAFEVHQDIERLLISNGAQEPRDFYGFHAMFGAITAKAVGRCGGVDLQASFVENNGQIVVVWFHYGRQGDYRSLVQCCISTKA